MVITPFCYRHSGALGVRGEGQLALVGQLLPRLGLASEGLGLVFRVFTRQAPIAAEPFCLAPTSEHAIMEGQ